MAVRQDVTSPRRDRDGQRPAPRRFVPPQGRRRLPVVAVAALVAVGSALVFAVLWMNAGDRRAVMAVAAPVAAGEVLEAEDLTAVRVSADPQLSVIPASARQEVVGRRAAVDLVAGTLLTTAHLRSGSPVAAGRAVVGVALDAGRLPAARLQPGDRVQVVQTLPPTGDPAATGDGPLGRVIADAEVAAVHAGDEAVASGSALVTLDLAEGDAPQVAGAAAADRVSLVQVAAP